MHGMKYRRWFNLVLLGAGLAAGCRKEAAAPPGPLENVNLSEPTEAQPKLPTIKLWLGAEQMDAEMAVTFKEEETGMMFRKTMGENDGMIFALPSTQQASFWMKNCYVPLSVAYIDTEGVIKEIHDLEPQNTNPVYSASADIRFALETPQGWFGKHNVREGMTIRTERGSLMETFFQGR